MKFAWVGPVTAVRGIVKRQRERRLSDAYKLAWDQWVEDGEEEVWDLAVGDGLEPEDWSAERAPAPARED